LLTTLWWRVAVEAEPLLAVVEVAAAQVVIALVQVLRLRRELHIRFQSVLAATVELLVKVGLQETGQAAVTLFFLPLHQLVGVVVVLAAWLVLGKQAGLVAAAVTMAALVVLETLPPQAQVKETMAGHQMPPTMVGAVVAVLQRLAQRLPVQLLVALVVLVQPQASVVHQ
jgi:hypothetical protein